jgi:DNA-binding GntR family transcriptional regulator
VRATRPHRDAELFLRYGATPTEVALDDYERFVAACLAIDRARAADLVRAHPEYLQNPRALTRRPSGMTPTR